MRKVSYPNNCAVRERTADGVCVGRCWMALDDEDNCPRHGDVRKQMEKFRADGQLFDDPRTQQGAEHGE